MTTRDTDPAGPTSAPAGGLPRLPPAGPGPAADPDPGPDPDADPDADPEESLQRMLVITGLLTAAGLTACLNVTRDIPDVTAWLPQPGGRDIKIIIDDDGYIELRFWTSPGTTPSHVTRILTGAIAALNGSG
jgi:hypothetical protein